MCKNRFNHIINNLHVSTGANRIIISNHHHFNDDHFLYSFNNIIKLIL